MKEKIFFTVFIILIILGRAYASDTTLVGLRAGTNPQIIGTYIDLNARVSRQIILDHQITLSNLNTFKNNLQTFSDSGIVNIVCLRFPTDISDSHQADRVPLLDPIDLDSCLNKVTQFLTSLDSVLDYVQIQNEPLGGPGKFYNFDDDIHYGYYAIQWLDTLGKHIKNQIQANGLNIGIISPGFHDVGSALENDSVINSTNYIRSPGDTIFVNTMTDEPLARFWYKNLMEISKKSSEIIDIHLNVENINVLISYIEELDSLQEIITPVSTILPLTTLEWSQAKEKDLLIRNTPWMVNFLDSAYFGNPKPDSVAWFSFMDSLDYDTTFMQSAFDIFCEKNFKHACYAGLYQFGSMLGQQIFSTCALVTNITTDIPVNNRPFYKLYKNLQACDSSTEIKKSITKAKEEPAILIYPLPSKDNVTIKWNEQNQNNSNELKIYSIHGQLIKTVKTDNSEQIVLDISDMEKGMYILKQNNNAVGKLLKQ